MVDFYCFCFDKLCSGDYVPDGLAFSFLHVLFITIPNLFLQGCRDEREGFAQLSLHRKPLLRSCLGPFPRVMSPEVLRR